MGSRLFCRALAKKAGISPRQAKEYVVSNLHNLEHEEAVDALLHNFADYKIRKWTGRDMSGTNRPVIF